MAGHQHEVEETLKRINAHRGVFGIMIMNADGLPIKSTMDPMLSVQYAGLLTSLCVKCRNVVRDLDATNDLTFLRIRTAQHEIMIAPDKEYTLVVVQMPTD